MISRIWLDTNGSKDSLSKGTVMSEGRCLQRTVNLSGQR